MTADTRPSTIVVARRKIVRRGDYGFDAPHVPIAFAVATLLGLSVAAASVAFSMLWLTCLSLLVSMTFAFSASSYLWITRHGKFVIWAELLDAQGLRGDERLLDVGCGRGAVLMLAAERLPRGHVTGIDLWSTIDQSGNSERVARRNAELEGVGERVELRTGDMRKLPFPDASFDVVTSSLAIHNIADEKGREQALSEIWRVLKPDGTALIADFRYTANYQQFLAAQSGTTVERRRLGWQFWYGGPYAATSLVTVRR